jgi:hypothetical protein
MALSVVAFLIAAAAAYLMLELGLEKLHSTDLVVRYVDNIDRTRRASWRNYLLLNDPDIFRVVFVAPIFYAIGGLFASLSPIGFIIFQISALPLVWYYVICIVFAPVYGTLALFLSSKTVLGLVYFIEPVFSLIILGIHVTAYQRAHFHS